MNANVSIQVLPKGDIKEVIRIVDTIIAYIQSTGLKYFVGPTETSIEGDLDELMEIVKRCQYLCVEAGSPSAMSYVKINYQPSGDVLTIDEKTAKYHQER